MSLEHITLLTKCYPTFSSLVAKNTPDINFVLNLDLSKSVRHSEAELDLHYGRNPKSQDERLYVSAIVNNEGDARTLKMDGKIKVTFPAKVIGLSRCLNNLQSHAGLVHIMTGRNLSRLENPHSQTTYEQL